MKFGSKFDTLIIFAHPGSEGHNVFILSKVKESLIKRGESFEVLDLYKMGFDPVLKKGELYSSKDKFIDEKILGIQEKIINAKKLIFIYPVWWNGPPAILKGFFDRVFASKFAFKYVKILNWFYAPKPLLKGKKAVIFVTTGAPKILSWLVQGFRGSRIVKSDILRFCGIRSRIFRYGPANRISEDVKVKLSSLVEKGLNWLYQ